MTNGKCRNEYENFLPVLGRIDSTKGYYKHDVIIPFNVKNMLGTQLKIQFELFHSGEIKKGKVPSNNLGL
jgi:hypothetical protein